MSIDDVEYHNGYAAVNVKVYKTLPGKDSLIPLFERIGWDEEKFNEHIEVILEGICKTFWEEDAQTIGSDYGYVHVYSQGRGNGWAVPYYYLTEDSFIPDIDVEAEGRYYQVKFESTNSMSFYAEDEEHAREQATNAKPHDPIVAILESIGDSDVLENFLLFQREIKEFVKGVPNMVYEQLLNNLAEFQDEFDLAHSVTARHFNLVYQERHYPNYGS